MQTCPQLRKAAKAAPRAATLTSVEGITINASLPDASMRVALNLSDAAAATFLAAGTLPVNATA